MRNITKQLFIVISLGFCLKLQSQSCACPYTNWAKNIGGSQYVKPGGITKDNSGNIYVVGSFLNSATFGSFTLTSAGSKDIFIAKMDSLGNWLWAIKAGGTNLEEALSISIDIQGNIYMAGMYQLSTSIGGVTLAVNSSNNLFIAKLNAAGQWQWVIKAGLGEYAEDFNRLKIVNDDLGNIYYTTSLYFGSVLGADTIKTFGYNYKDIVVAKLNSNGNWLWTTHAGKNGFDSKSNDIILNSNSEIFIAGLADMNTTFKNSTLASLENGAFYARLDSNGNWQTLIQCKGGEATSLARDKNGFLFLAGGFQGMLSNGVKTVTSYGNSDVFIAKFDNNGNCNWITKAGDIDADMAIDIDVTSGGDPIVTGYAQYMPVFGNLITPYFSPSSSSKFISKLNTLDGSWCWVKQIGEGIRDENKQATIVDSFGSIYSLNSVNGNNSFDTIIPLSIGCVLVQTNEKNTKLFPIPNQTISIGDSVIIDIEGVDIDSFSVFPLSGFVSKQNKRLILSPLNSTLYTVMSYDKCGNKDSVVFTITVNNQPNSILDNTKNDFLSYFPNPTTRKLFLKTENHTTITILDLNGKILQTQDLDKQGQIDITSLSSGMYLLRTEEGLTRKFIKE